MTKKTALIITALIIVLLGSWWILFGSKKTSLTSSQPDGQLQLQAKAPVQISKTTIAYNDPSGFSFNYPDNLSLVRNDPKNEHTYADLNLSSKDVEGSLSIVISDTNFTNLADWVKANQTKDSSPAKEVKLGNLKAMETVTGDKILTGALDLGILFTIELTSKDRKDFWTEAYNKVLSDFTFVPAQTGSSSSSGGSASDVIFEGEEAIN